MSIENKQGAWYQQWFDTPFYHQLYQHRDDTEARIFIDALVQYLNPDSTEHFLDLACGRGRHAHYLHQKGYRVTGLDLSPSNIQYARANAEPGLDFQQGDMRQNFGTERYHYILNLFTSFGYFDGREENLRACQAVKTALKPNGIFLLDFMNVHRVALGLVEEEVRNIDGVEFKINRRIEQERVVKSIDFDHEGRSYHFEEKVQLLELHDFKQLFEASNLKLVDTFGDYNLGSFDERHSERLILMARS
jgi:SAM-dependent methyltransferase